MRCPLFATLPLLAFFGFMITPAVAQEPAASPSPSATPVPAGVPEWRFSSPGGSFVVPLRSIVSVSMHEYLVDGAARVTEANVDTTGNALVRFYCIEPVSVQTPLGLGQSTITKLKELAAEASQRSGQEETWKKVTKSYPGSTHAHTIEFRVDSQDDVEKIFTSADTALRTSKDSALTLK